MLFSGMPGPMELLIILGIVLVIFGAGKLPQVGGNLGKAIRNFKGGLSPEEKELKEGEAAKSEKIEEKSQAEKT